MKTSLTILACILLGLCSCESAFQRTDVVAVTSVEPVLQVPPKPQMELMTPDEIAEYDKLSSGLRAKLERNNQKLKEFAMELKVTIDIYNASARNHNANDGDTKIQNLSKKEKTK